MSGAHRLLMLVSARADTGLREEIRLGRRPCPEYLRLEERHGVQLLDWSRLRYQARHRSARVSLYHVAAALKVLPTYDAVLSDGEHLGLPLALAMRRLGRSRPHVVIGHHLTSGRKPVLFQALRPDRGIDRLLFHSLKQLDLASRNLGIPRQKLAFQPYGVDQSFWSPRSGLEEALVVSAGREHRDYATLGQAAGDLPVQIYVADGSTFSPYARHARSGAWPANVRTGFADRLELRQLYARAAVVVVPLIPNDFQAGVTTVMEAMSMGKAVVATDTDGQRDIVEDGVTGVTVPAGDPAALRDTIASLLAKPRERRRLGANARAAVENRFSVDTYAASLAQHLETVATSVERSMGSTIEPAPSEGTGDVGQVHG